MIYLFKQRWMVCLKVTPLKGFPALVARTRDGRLFLVISDLHIGMTAWMGLRRPSPEEEAKDVLERVVLACHQADAHNIIVLGDLKHRIFEPTMHERKALRSLTEGLAEDFEVWVMKGNHDYGIEECLDERVRIVGKGGLEIEKTVFMHGHSLPRLAESPESYDMMVCGHVHPQWIVNGEWSPVWLTLKGHGVKPAKVIMLPHFSRYASRAGYRPGPPSTVAPFLKRLRIGRYGYEVRDLQLKKVASGKASEIIASGKE